MQRELFTTVSDSIKSFNHDAELFKPPLNDSLPHSYSAEELTTTEN
jgi:hypothetical protein